MKFETNNLNAEFYLASLALGVLEAMKQGVVHPDIGIWSLGRLQCSQQFESSLVLSDDIKYVIGCMDEITAWVSLDPKHGLEKQQILAMSVEHIPTFVATLVVCLSEQVFKNAGLTKMALKNFNRDRANFILAVNSIVNDY